MKWQTLMQKIFSYKIFKGDIVAPRTITISDTYMCRISAQSHGSDYGIMIAQDVLLTYNIPLVGTKVIFPKERNVGLSYMRTLVHDTMLNDDSYKTRRSIHKLSLIHI